MATSERHNDVPESRDRFALQRINYILLAIGFGVILLGFLLMSGGGSDDPAVFNPAIFGFRRITLAPIMVTLGFVLEIVAIMYRKRNR